MSKIFSGGGKLYFEKAKSDGTFEPIMYFGTTDGITLTTSVEWKEHFNSEGCTPLLDAKYPSKKSVDVSFSTSEITLEMQNRAFLGNLVDVSQAIATSVAISVMGSMVVVGSIVDYGYYNATEVIVAKGANTLVLGIDYTLDVKAGYIGIIAGGGIVTGDALLITVTAPAIAMSLSATMKQSAIEGRFTVITSSQTSNNYKYVFKKLSVTQDGDFNLKGDEIGSLSFNGSALISGDNMGDLSDYLDIIELDSSDC